MTNLIVQLAAGATATDIQAALNTLPDGATLRLAANQTILVSKTLIMDVSQRSITLDLNGSTLKQVGTSTILQMSGAHATARDCLSVRADAFLVRPRRGDLVARLSTGGLYEIAEIIPLGTARLRIDLVSRS